MPDEDDPILNPSRSRIAGARRWVFRHGPWPLWRALELLEEVQPHARLTGPLWMLAEAGTRINRLLDEAWRRSGRAVVDEVMALHRALGSVEAGSGQPRLPAEFVSRCDAFLEAARATKSPWRTMLTGWVDTMHERLTMHRYPDPCRRARHARALIVEPVRLAVGRSAVVGGSLGEETNAELDALADRAMAFVDLTRAADDALHGWNRIDLPEAERLGGFFGLADEARPPDETAVRAHARQLLVDLSVWEGRSLDPRLDRWASAVVEAMREGLAHYLKTGGWLAPSPPSRSGAADAFKRLFGKGRACYNR